MRDIIPIEIEDIEKIEKEKIKSIEYYSYTRRSWLGNNFIFDH